MSRAKSGLSLGEMAILGVLRERPMHGYEIAHRFAADLDLGLVLPLDMSNVYAMLKDLQEQGLIEGTREVVGKRPPRTVFHTTEEAEEILHQWLEEPVRRLREIRADFLVKLYFNRTIGVSATARLLDAQIPVSRAYADRMVRLAAEAEPGSFGALVWSSKVGVAHSTLAWLEGERARLTA